MDAPCLPRVFICTTCAASTTTVATGSRPVDCTTLERLLMTSKGFGALRTCTMNTLHRPRSVCRFKNEPWLGTSKSDLARGD